MSLSRLPFSRLSGREWGRLGVAAVVGLYLCFVTLSVATRGMFEYVGIDFRTIRSSAQIASEQGFAAVYDLEAQRRVQLPIYETYSLGQGRMPYDTVPMPYLPFFVALTLPLLIFDPLVGFMLSRAFDIILLIAYLCRLRRAVRGQEWAILVLCLSFPVFSTLFFGQVNVWLLIFLGEFLLSATSRRELQAGMWLGGLLLKPQTLVLLVPGLVLARRWRILAGLAVTSTVILGASVALGGVQGMISLARLIFLYPQGLPTTFPESMMNWRAIGINLEPLLGPQVSLAIAVSATFVTAALALVPWYSVRKATELRWPALLLGTYAATCAVTWHSHVHMALPLVAPLLAQASEGGASPRVIYAWSLVPAAVFVLGSFAYGPGIGHRVVGTVELAFNLGLLALSLRWSRQILTPRTLAFGQS